MKKHVSKGIFVSVIAICSGTMGYGQLVDFNSENPYNKVFIATDNFGSSYLSILDLLPYTNKLLIVVDILGKDTDVLLDKKAKGSETYLKA